MLSLKTEVIRCQLTIPVYKMSDNEFIYRFMRFLKERKKYWLLPIILTLLLFGTLTVLTGDTAMAPFIYTLF